MRTHLHKYVHTDIPQVGVFKACCSEIFLHKHTHRHTCIHTSGGCLQRALQCRLMQKVALPAHLHTYKIFQGSRLCKHLPCMTYENLEMLNRLYLCMPWSGEGLYVHIIPQSGCAWCICAKSFSREEINACIPSAVLEQRNTGTWRTALLSSANGTGVLPLH